MLHHAPVANVLPPPPRHPLACSPKFVLVFRLPANCWQASDCKQFVHICMPTFSATKCQRIKLNSYLFSFHFTFIYLFSFYYLLLCYLYGVYSLFGVMSFKFVGEQHLAITIDQNFLLSLGSGTPIPFNGWWTTELAFKKCEFFKEMFYCTKVSINVLRV